MITYVGVQVGIIVKRCTTLKSAAVHFISGWFLFYPKVRCLRAFLRLGDKPKSRRMKKGMAGHQLFIKKG